jgi:hypothetical protein
MTERTCPVCGKTLVNRPPHAKYCSRNCYNEAQRARTPAKVRPEHVDAAKRALAALDDEQREAIRMMVEDAW